MKTGTTELLKFQRLQRRLKESVRGIVGLLELLWQRAAKNCPRGDVGKFSNEDIAVLVDWPGDPDELVAALTETGWLDLDETHRLIVHDWHEHAPNWVKGVVLRNGGSFATLGSALKVADQSSVHDPGSGTQGGAPPFLSLPIPNPTSPSPSSSAGGETEEEAVEDFINQLEKSCREKIPSCPMRLKEALQTAIGNGLTHAQVKDRCKWFQAHGYIWAKEFRPGVFYTGLMEASPTMAAKDGWPHKNGQATA